MSTIIDRKLTGKSLKSNKALAKREFIKQAATELLVEFGYQETSLDAICQKASCSKSAIYQHFGNKQGLLAALTEDVAIELSQALHAFHLQEMDIKDALLMYAKLAMAKILNDRHVAVVRATISSLGQFPELGPTYYRVGAQTAQAALIQYFSAKVTAKELDISDSTWAAHEFQGLLFWEKLVAQVVGAQSSPSEEEIENHSSKVVNTFLNRYRIVKS
jgi:TetR/AcrR family transcriptional regulator, mexJK operon transcriptional repressor